MRPVSSLGSLNYLKEVGIWTVVSRRVEKMTRSSLMASVDLSKTNLLSRINRFSAPHISQRSRCPARLELWRTECKNNGGCQKAPFRVFSRGFFCATNGGSSGTLGGD